MEKVRGSRKAWVGKTKTGLKDGRYRKTEKALMDAFFDGQKRMSVAGLIKKAGISNSTFYRHHGSVQDIMPDIEERTVGDFTTDIQKVEMKKGVQVRFLYYRMLNYILQHKQVFEMIVDRGDERTLEAMVQDLLPNVIKNYHLPAKYAEMLAIYQKEVTAVVENWIKEGFSTSELGVLGDIMYLTKSARQRLMAIGR